MKTCANHPERDAAYVCLKHEVHLCEECRRCGDPELYCRHREMCVIHFLDREGRAEAGHSDSEENLT